MILKPVGSAQKCFHRRAGGEAVISHRIGILAAALFFPGQKNALSGSAGGKARPYRRVASRQSLVRGVNLRGDYPTS